MPLRVDRRGVERGLRLAAWVALLGLAGGSVTDGRVGGWAVARSAGHAELAAWTVDPRVAGIHLEVARGLDARTRDWLAALRAAGTPVTWSGEVPAVAASVTRATDPAGGVVVRIAAPEGTSVAVADELGPLDSAESRSGGVTFALATTVPMLRVTAAGVTFEVRVADSLAARRVAVLAAAGWEAKFLISALEERGWGVDARLVLAPGIATVQGRPWPLDTARHAAVVLLDSVTPGEARSAARFARAGGGVVLGPRVIAPEALGPLAPGRVGAAVRPPRLTPDGPEPRLGLVLRPAALDDRAVALETRGGRVAVSAVRAGAGRVALVGYEDTWRWRMTGGDDGVEAHRAWWADILGAAAYRAAAPVAGPAGAAPVAEWVRALGPATPAPPAETVGFPLWPVALVVCGASLLLEWTSRRLRGAP
jgi:hypothetical protein